MSEIRIDLNRRLGRIDRNIYGHFIEHLGRCIYGGIYEPGSPLADNNGFRKDVLDSVRALQVPILRWPGGNFVSGYHWMDGVGPREQRPQRPELAWNAIETNKFGTNEFIEFSRIVGCEPYICANLGNGSIDEAQAWVEYCNGTDDTHYANLRRSHGYDKPHAVKYWGLGNEIYGQWQIGHKSAEDYAKTALEFAKVMKWADPSIVVVACGAQNLEWDWEVLKTVGHKVEYISAHFYFGPDAATKNGGSHAAHYSLLSVPRQVDEYIQILWQLIQAARRQFRIPHEIKIALDEWNVWYRERAISHRLEDRRVAPAQLEERYDLTDALCVAAFLNLMHRRCTSIGMANLAQLVNVIAPIMTRSVSTASETGTFHQTIYYPLKNAVELSGEIALDAWVECESFQSSRTLSGSVPYLDVSATLDEHGHQLFLSVVNFHHEQAMETSIRLHDATIKRDVTRHCITADRVDATNSFDDPDRVSPSVDRIKLPGNETSFSFPPHSATVLELDLVL